jgi:hypothetical protein
LCYDDKNGDRVVVDWDLEIRDNWELHSNEGDRVRWLSFLKMEKCWHAGMPTDPFKSCPFQPHHI